MSRYDEHGPVDVDVHEHGPEWWAMGREVCRCGDPVDDHPEDPVGGLFPCRRLDCNCPDFLPALDNQ